MQLWDKILQLALLGSERTHLEPAVAASLRQYGLDPEDPLPQLILASAATLHQVQKIQVPIKTFDKDLPAPDPNDDDDLSLPETSLLHLKQILSGRYQRALPEFVQWLLDKQYLLPPEFLPDLLNHCLQDQDLFLTIQPLLGHRAKWLIAQHPQWKILIPQGNPANWSQAKYEERTLILAYLRKQKSPEAIAHLQTIWTTITPKQKLGFLDLLETGLSLRDEDFLESCLADKRKEIRLKAADLLARIPDSQLVQRLFQAILPLVTYKKDKLKIELPLDIPVATVKDGIVPQIKKGKSGGLKSSWLAACIARIPAACWMDHFKWTQAEMIELFGASNRSSLLLTALGKVSLRFKNVELAVNLMDYLVLRSGRIPEDLDWQALVKQIPASDVQDIASTCFQRQAGLLEEQHLLTKILELGIHPWSSNMAQQIVQGLKQWMAESKTFLWNIWHYKRLLEIAGYCAPTELLTSFEADWPLHSPVWNQWAPDVERMLQIMRFRIEMKRVDDLMV